MDRGPHGWAEEVRSQPDAQLRGVFSPSTRPCPPRLCGQPAGPASGSGRSPLCGLPAHSTWGGGCAPRLRVGCSSAGRTPKLFWASLGCGEASEKPLDLPGTDHFLTICHTAIQPSRWGESPRDSPGGPSPAGAEALRPGLQVRGPRARQAHPSRQRAAWTGPGRG